MKKTQTSKVLAALVLAGAGLLFAGNAAALFSPAIHFTGGPNLEKNVFNPGETITGTVELSNMSGGALGDLTLRCIFWKKNAEYKEGLSQEEISALIKNEDKNDYVPPMEFLAEVNDSRRFSLAADEKATRKFSCAVPENFLAGDLILWVRLFNGRGEEMSWADKKINVAGESKFLMLGNHWVATDDGKFKNPETGVYHQPGEIVNVVFDVKNDSANSISAFYKITNYARNVGTPAIAEEKKETFTIKAGEKITVKTALPKETTPETYLSEIQFFDQTTQKPVSNSIVFRWIISGENAKILFAGLDKDSYAAGETAQVKVGYTGSANPTAVDMGQGAIEAAIFDQSGENIGMSSQNVDLQNGSEAIIGLSVKKDAINPKLAVKITKDGKVLDAYEYVLETKIKPAAKSVPPASEGAKSNAVKLFLIAAAVIAAAVILIFMIKKGKKNSKIAALVLVFCGIFFGAAAQAQTRVAGCGAYWANWNSPLEGGTFHPGDWVRFQGGVDVAGCSNIIGATRFQFYITEGKDITLTNCLGSHTPYVGSYCVCGAGNTCTWSELYCKPSGSCGWTGNCFGGDRVMWLDQGHGDKIFQFGKQWMGGYRRYAYYDYWYQIPEDISFSGPVRFYIDIAAHHDGYGWEYSVYYVKGFLAPNNQSPVANPDAYNVSKNGTLAVADADGVLKNDTDPNGDALTAIAATLPAHGSLTLNAKGGFTYTPVVDYSGTDSFTYQAYDGVLRSSPATVTLTVANGLPVANADLYTTAKDTDLAVLAANGVLKNDTDPDNDPLTAIKVQNPAHGALIAFNANGGFTYRPNAGYTGDDSFTYKASDGTNESNAVTVKIAVVLDNQKPVAVSNSYVVGIGQTLVVPDNGVLANDYDPDNGPSPLKAKNFTKIGAGGGTLTPNASEGGGFTFVAPAAAGLTQYTYRAYDGANYSDTADMALNISVVNLGEPAANNDSYDVSNDADGGEDFAIAARADGVLGNDTDPDAGETATLVAVKVAPANDTDHGMLTFNANGTFTYTPDAGFYGTDTFTYQAKDIHGNLSNVAKVTFNVSETPPFAAKMECSASNCGANACDNTPGAAWSLYRPTADNPCNFQINNVSIGDVYDSDWRFDNTSNPYNKTTSGKSSYGTVQSDVPQGGYAFTLTVNDAATPTQTDTDTRQINVKDDANAGFACSLNQTNWFDCSTLGNHVAAGEKLYLKDDSGTGQPYSTASTGASIVKRAWSIQYPGDASFTPITELGGVPLGVNEPAIYVVLKAGINVLRLEIEDDAGRKDGQNYNAKGVKTPTWNE